MADVISDDRRKDLETRRAADQFMRDAGWYPLGTRMDKSSAEAHEQARFVAAIQDVLEQFGHETHARRWATEVVELVSNLDTVARERGEL